ncbi:MAG: DUF1501 domain-containing protein [Bacteroidota bacterium]
MKRRDFLSAIGPLAAAPLLLNGIPVRAMSNQFLKKFAMNADNDRVLILVQLHGGNDGLNTIIPLNSYAEYVNLRPNIAIPDTGSRAYLPVDTTLPSDQQAAFHPDMADAKSLYDDGKMNIVQGVTYPNTNQSHFRGRDIWFGGGSYDEFKSSGWMGRYLEFIFPDFPEGHPSQDMPDPVGLEVGGAVSFGFQRDSGVPAAIAVEDPVAFFDLINGVGGALPTNIQGTHFGEELSYLMGLEQQANDYAARLKSVYESGTNSASVTYPTTYSGTAPANYQDNELAWQLQLIARLLAGGIKTKVFLTRLSRFDTHNDQTLSNDPTMGAHAALLYHLSTAMKAFQDDLQALGLEDRVLSMTFSEFGRRPTSNGSFGTDHGKAAPMLVFGKGVNGGMTGLSPDLSDLDSSNNLKMQYDYRDVFIDVLENWMGADKPTIDYTFDNRTGDPNINLINPNFATDIDNPDFSQKPALYPNTPNPVQDETLVRFFLAKHSHVKIGLFDMQGKELTTLVDEDRAQGVHELTYQVTHLTAGTYMLAMEAEGYYAARKMVVK